MITDDQLTPAHVYAPALDPAPMPGAGGRQVGGDHYLGRACQPWDIIDAWDLDFFEGNALKYLLRRKPGALRSEDLRKAIHYLERAAERAEDAECNL